MNSRRRAVYAIFAVFFFESVVLGNWIPRIPDIKDKLALSDFSLGLALLAIPMGTIVAFMAAGKVVGYSGLRNGCRIWLPAFSLCFLLPGLVPTFGLLFLVLLLAGLAVGMCEVSMNTKADMIEAQVGGRIMSRCHGFWSLGSMAGAIIGSAFAHFHWSLDSHFLLVMPLIAIAGYFCATALPDDFVTASDQPADMNIHPFKLPSKAILMLCLMPVGIMTVEGAFIDWSALFMRSVLDASPIIIGVTYSFFSIVMAITRLCGDSLAERFGDLAVVRYSGLAATAGIAIFASAPVIPVAFLGATLAGLGVAIVYPLAISAAARRPGNPTDNVAAMSLLAFSAFLVAPPLIGMVSDFLGLRIALLLLVPLAMLTPVLAKEIEK